MTKKQKKVLRRIIISAVLLVAMAVTFTVLDKTGMVDLENPSVYTERYLTRISLWL